jgi:hypothetical protein
MLHEVFTRVEPLCEIPGGGVHVGYVLMECHRCRLTVRFPITVHGHHWNFGVWNSIWHKAGFELLAEKVVEAIPSIESKFDDCVPGYEPDYTAECYRNAGNLVFEAIDHDWWPELWHAMDKAAGL